MAVRVREGRLPSACGWRSAIGGEQVSELPTVSGAMRLKLADRRPALAQRARMLTAAADWRRDDPGRRLVRWLVVLAAAAERSWARCPRGEARDAGYCTPSAVVSSDRELSDALEKHRCVPGDRGASSIDRRIAVGADG